MLEKDVGKILEATLSSGTDVRIKVMVSLTVLCFSFFCPHTDLIRSTAASVAKHLRVSS